MALSKFFEPQTHEPEIYERWEQSGAFRADPRSEKPPFTIVLPPPNATGTLHLGHAVMLALQDAMIRYKRMNGFETLWVPGTDHAAIATESVVIRMLREQGMDDPRAELGREELVRRIAEFVASSRHRIREQVRAIGSSCDWSRERYTMDPQLNRCVNGVFARMFRDGLIYRGPRVVNWDPGLRTTLSDDEVYHETRRAKFYTIRYGPFLVGTSRPETKLGDTAVAVHPDDERWAEHVGKTYEIPWPNGPTLTVRVVADPEIDRETGTGVVGVTPAHSHVDFEIATRHSLPMLQVIGEDGRMTEAAGAYAGMTVADAREAFVRDLDAAGLLVKVEEYDQPVSLSYRSKQPVEPLLKEQWFVDVNQPAVAWKGRLLSIREVLHQVVADGSIQILPQHQEKIYFHWIENLRDWCISRQIWWGHRIPVWYRGSEDMYVGNLPPEGAGWEQDPDTLDTWFSSALWTWSTMVDVDAAADPAVGLRELLAQSPDFMRFHPTDVLETGYDILFFWVTRMILMTTYATGQVPFRTVYLHGLILDRDGDKMSKSKPDTAIDPLETIAEFGADALRLSMVIGNSPGQNLKLGKERITGFTRLMNKIWNAGRLVEGALASGPPAPLDVSAVVHPVNRWMLRRLDDVVQHSTRRLDALQIGDVGERMRIAFWSEFCDIYLEAIKEERLRALPETRDVLAAAFGTYLKLFHPYTPYITEHLWGELGFGGLLIEQAWPVAVAPAEWQDDEEGIDAVVRLVGAVRRMRTDQGIDPAAKVQVEFVPLKYAEVFSECGGVIARLTGAESLRTREAGTGVDDGAVVSVDPAFEVSLAVSAADLAAEAQRLQKELEGVQRQLESARKQLANPKFVERAAPNVVQHTREREAELARLETTLQERLNGIPS